MVSFLQKESLGGWWQAAACQVPSTHEAMPCFPACKSFKSREGSALPLSLFPLSLPSLKQERFACQESCSCFAAVPHTPCHAKAPSFREFQISKKSFVPRFYLPLPAPLPLEREVRKREEGKREEEEEEQK